MLETFSEAVKKLYDTDRNLYGLATLGIIAGMGISLGLITEAALWLLGIKGGTH